jgi:2-oxoisovalerate dehydrogenase E1 component
MANNSSPGSLEPRRLIDIYRRVSRIREVDRAMQAGLSAGKFRFTYWPSTGQEIIPAVVASLLETSDYVVTTYRGIHDQVAKGVPLKGLFAEALGREGGLNKGKGGSPHISDPASGSILTTGIVGAGAPIANGLALATQLREGRQVTVVNFGDGATSIGAVHEAMNLAGLWRLPVIFLCQNNQFGEYTLVPDYTATKELASRAAGYGFTGVRLDSTDVTTFHNEMQKIIAQARAGNGPFFVEAMTLRLGPHAGVGDNNLLGADALQAGKAKWPAVRLREQLISTGVCTEQEVEAIDAAARAEVQEAVDFGLASKVTGVEEMLIDVYRDPDDVPRRGHYPVRAAEGAVAGETKMMTIAEAVCHTQDLALAKDPGVFLLGEDIGDPPGGVFKTSLGLQTKWGKKRVRPTPISEQAIIGAAMGASLVGCRPVAEIMFCDFLGVCLDQIANHVAKQRYMSGGATHAPLTIRALVGGGMGAFGAQHSQSLEAWLLHTPGLKVVYPSSPVEAKGLLTSCIFDDDPCVHLESMMLNFQAREQVPLVEYRIPLGVAKVKREGTDISLITFGWQVQQCLTAATELQKEGINAEVVDLRSLMPLDYHRVLDSVKKTRRALVVHAATEFCGLGAEIASTINEELFSRLKAPASRFGAAYAPIAYSRDIEPAQLPNSGSIAERVRQIIRYEGARSA